MNHKNLTIIGTSHIAKESIKEVQNVLDETKPDMIAVELDRARLYAILHPRSRSVSWRDIFKVGIKGFLFALMGAWATRKLGKMVGVPPGSDMMTAVRWARKNKTPLALIDQNIAITLHRFSQEITWREKGRFVMDIIKGFIFRKPIVTFDLRKVPSAKTIKKLLQYTKERYPNAYKVLVDERNVVMARRLAMLHKKHPDDKIVAIVGAGHEEEMMELYKKYIKKAKKNI